MYGTLNSCIQDLRYPFCVCVCVCVYCRLNSSLLYPRRLDSSLFSECVFVFVCTCAPVCVHAASSISLFSSQESCRYPSFYYALLNQQVAVIVIGADLRVISYGRTSIFISPRCPVQHPTSLKGDIWTTALLKWQKARGALTASDKGQSSPSPRRHTSCLCS